MTAPLISYDPTGAMISPGGVTHRSFTAFHDELQSARDEILAEAQLWADGVEPPADKQPLDAGFHHLPERLLAEARRSGDAGELHRIRATVDRLAARCDSIVVLGIGGSYMGARALMEACCHSYYNEIPAAERGGRPRIYFEGNNVDNDAVAGLLDLLQQSGSAAGARSTWGPGSRWGIVVISKSGGTLETAAVFRILLRELTRMLPAGAQIGDYVVPITGPGSKLDRLCSSIGCPSSESFVVPEGVGGRFSIFSAVGLLPAALAGLDLEQLLLGASAMNEHFAAARPGANAPLDYAGICHLAERDCGCTTRVLSTWGKSLESLGLWYDQLLSESLGKNERGALPLTVVNTRDLHSRGQQHQQGRRDKLITNVFVDRWQREPLTIGSCSTNADGLDELADKSLPEILAAARAGVNQAYADDARPTANLCLPQRNEHALGQVLQMLMLATALEGRLVDVNPYGQPGVEDYKRNMNAILRGTRLGKG